MVGLTVDLALVGAAVEEDSHGFFTSVEDLVVVDLDVVAAFGGDDACGSVKSWLAALR